jgi:hypothetical protein
MSRKILPSLRITLAVQEARWNLFHNALDKRQRKKLNYEMLLDIHRSYISACPYPVQDVKLRPILVSIVFCHYNHPKECVEIG